MGIGIWIPCILLVSQDVTLPFFSIIKKCKNHFLAHGPYKDSSRICLAHGLSWFADHWPRDNKWENVYDTMKLKTLYEHFNNYILSCECVCHVWMLVFFIFGFLGFFQISVIKIKMNIFVHKDFYYGLLCKLEGIAILRFSLHCCQLAFQKVAQVVFHKSPK